MSKAGQEEGGDWIHKSTCTEVGGQWSVLWACGLGPGPGWELGSPVTQTPPIHQGSFDVWVAGERAGVAAELNAS